MNFVIHISGERPIGETYELDYKAGYRRVSVPAGAEVHHWEERVDLNTQDRFVAVVYKVPPGEDVT